MINPYTKRIEIRRLRSEILAPAEMARLVFGFLLLLLLARHVYTTHCTGQTIRPELRKGLFQRYTCGDVPSS